MARKINPHTKPTPAAVEPDINDLSVLHPDVTLTVGARAVTVREYRFLDGMRARAKGAPLIADLTTLVESGDAIEATTEDYLTVLAAHEALVRELMVESIDGADADWLDGLSAADGELVLLSWWGVCGRFFVRRVLARLQEKLLHRLRAAASAGATSLPPSPAPDMGAPTLLAPGTPSVN